MLLLLAALLAGPFALPPGQPVRPPAGQSIGPPAGKDAGVLPPPRWPADIDLSAGTDVDEDYRHQFALCDADGSFRGHAAAYHGCRGDPNNATELRRLPDGAIAFTAKLAVDLDGSPFACSADHGPTDQCPTSLMLPGADGTPVPVDSDAVPYVVIPAAGPPDVHGEFSRLTGVHTGDVGVVVYHGRVVPVIVADTGPYSMLGEGSLALHRALGRELCTAHDAAGRCSAVVDPMESIEGDVTTVLFPGSAPDGLTPDTIAATVRTQAMRLWRAAPVSRTVRTAPAPAPAHAAGSAGSS